LYFNIHPTTTDRARADRPEYAQRGTLGTVAAINALFAECDGVHEVTQEEAAPRYVAPDVTGLTLAQERAAIKSAWDRAADAYFVEHFDEMMQRARARVDAAPVPPSAVWCSGGGYQAVWLLRDTVDVTPANLDDLRDVQRRWVATVGADPAAADLTRVLRVPGSRNWKSRYGPGGAAVAWLWCDLATQYDLATLRDLATVDPATRPRPGGGGGGGGQFGPADNPPPMLPDTAAVVAFNRAADIRALLLERGYTDAGSGRMNRPGGSGRALVLNADNTATVWGSSDPLFTGGRRVTPADVVCVYDHSGDVAATLAALGGDEEARTRAEIDAALAWVGGADAVERLQAAGIRRAADYLRTLTALLLAARTRGSWQVALSSRQLGERRNISHTSARRHVQRLRDAGLLEIVEDDNGALFDLSQMRSLTVPPFSTREHLQSGTLGDLNAADAYTPAHIADDVYVPVTYPRAIVRRAEGGPLVRSLTSSALRVVATLALYPDATAGDLAALCGLSTNAVRGQLRALAQNGLILWEREGRTRVYTLRPDHEARLDELRPNMTGYGAGLILAAKNAEDRARWADYQAREAGRAGEREEEAHQEKRAARLRRRGAAAAADLAAAGIDPNATPDTPDPTPRDTIQTQAQTIGKRKDKRPTPTIEERERWAEFKRHLAAARAAWPEIVAWCEMTGTSYAAAVWDADALVDLYMLFLADTVFQDAPNIAYVGTVGA
jgi:DNA-binding transcriptional ArsR family regulator